MQTNHSLERKKKPFLWIIFVVAVLLAGAFVLYSWSMRTHPPQVSPPVVARGKIPPPPPSSSVESPAGPSSSMESAQPTEADSPKNASGTGLQSDLELPPAASMDTDREASDDAEQTGASDSSGSQAPAPASDDDRPATTAVDELQAEGQETPESPPSPETVASAPSDLSATDAEAVPTASPPSVPEKANPYAIQVGAYRKKDNADRQVAQLREMGFDAYLYEKNNKDQRAWYFVRFGRFEDFGSADKALAAFKAQERMDGTIVRSNSN